jgi:hypothetical protein
MLDNPDKTTKLLAALKAAVPFEVELTEWLVKQLRAQHHAGADQKHHTVSDLSYAGDEGGIVCHIVPPAAARRVPGLLFAGEQDLESRKRIISGRFALNRRAGALWAFAEEPNAGHVVGRSREMAAIFFDAATTLGVVTFDPMAMVAGLAALLGGVVVFGSNTSTANQLSESMRSAEAQRAALIGQLDIRLVEDAPANRHS